MSKGAKIKALREERGMSQSDLADLLKTTKQTIYKYETGIVTNIPSDKIEAMSKIFNVSPAYLLGWEDRFPDDDTFQLNWEMADIYFKMRKSEKLTEVVKKLCELPPEQLDAVSLFLEALKK